MDEAEILPVAGPATLTIFVSMNRPGSIAMARDGARAFVECLPFDVGREAADSVALVVSELVTNALRHAGGSCVLSLAALPDAVEVAVGDSSLVRPQWRISDRVGGGGFGWPMVHRLARSVTVTGRAGGGKTVRAMVPCGAGRTASDSSRTRLCPWAPPTAAPQAHQTERGTAGSHGESGQAHWDRSACVCPGQCANRPPMIAASQFLRARVRFSSPAPREIPRP
ncbi:ATP-binding protein [Streptomyces sp. S465]|uniref:ATP-binding protein n=1 Tax=Streptomyces sp. S465 TaxID=2979468 RepID=UPI002E381637|nr:ATP-binding protein [Streptomyces sp. S465]